MKIVRYADDFRILCNSKEDAEKIKIAVERKLKIRFRLECSSEKTSRKFAEAMGRVSWIQTQACQEKR